MHNYHILFPCHWMSVETLIMLVLYCMFILQLSASYAMTWMLILVRYLKAKCHQHLHRESYLNRLCLFGWTLLNWPIWHHSVTPFPIFSLSFLFSFSHHWVIIHTWAPPSFAFTSPAFSFSTSSCLPSPLTPLLHDHPITNATPH